MKKIIWIVIGCIGIGLLSYGVLGAADTPASAEMSQEAKGQYVRVDDGGKRIVVSVGGQEASYPISSTVWVYRNNQKSSLADLKAGDSLELILNNKDQAAYIKAFSAAEPAPAQPGQTPSESAAGSSTAAPSGAATDSTTAAAGDEKAAGPVLPPAAGNSGASGAAGATGSQGSVQKPASSAGKSSASSGTASSAAAGSPGWEKLEFEWKSREFELKVKQDPKKPADTELYLKTQDRSVIHLDGVAAESFIQQLVKGLPAEQKTFEQALKQKIASEFQLANRSADWKLDVKWADKPQPPSHPQEPKGKGNEKSKDSKEKEQGKGKEKHDDHDDDD
ncbi:hypothetical protein DVH26_01235 [Paenibacillus sp. H1-7]|uniref:hypothetical protein n=1 Tax=Paenibacillus sp. H1-7 TaxID=2282849 RepID=UPI001EF90FB0|nr:hypothetical protein [Paenibacillus sp. H1-7]ULL13220.1 hypothetical protein DVH26_01235 [Paenibacillus sp. H1-7]